MEAEEIYQAIQRKRAEEDIRQLFEQRLPDRVRRYFEVKPHSIISNSYFSAVSAECIELFREGHFYGCIVLAQAVVEALVKFLCEKNQWRSDKVFEKNVKKLFKRKFISDSANKSLLQIWAKRDDYHHLNPKIETDKKNLEVLAKERVQLLNEVEAEIFHFELVNGKIAPTHPKYWDIDDGKADVYLRCT